MNQPNFLAQYDPDNLQNIVLDLKRRVDALSQSFVSANSASELFNQIGNLQYRAVDPDGSLRMIMSAVDLFEDLGVHAHLAGLDANGVVQFYLSADDGKIVFGGGDGWLDQFGLTFANQEGFVQFLDTTDGGTMQMYSDADNFLVLINQFGGKGISFLIDDASHNVAQIDFRADGIDLFDGAYKINGNNIGYSILAGGTIPGGFSPADATTYYWGGGGDSATTSGRRRIYIPRAGTVKRIDLFMNFAAGSSETSVVSFRLNDTTDTTISSSVNLSSAPFVANVTGLSIAVALGNFFEIKWVTPTWITNPTSVTLTAMVWIEPT
jgi:hypothetical protein